MPELSLIDYVLVALAGVAAGLINALAGGGTLLSFPVLTAVGLPAVAANVTNTVALSPGYLGATLAQAKDLHGQGARLRLMLPAAVIGGLLGAVLLLNTGERLFGQLVPWLILLAAGLLAVGDPLRKWLLRRGGPKGGLARLEQWAALPVGLAAIYGGYFGAGLSVIVLAVLGLTVDDTLVRLNGLKQLVAFSTNIAAAVFFLFSGQVAWAAALVLAVGALAGGALGGRLASRIPSSALRWLVVVVGVGVGLAYLFR